MIKRLISKDRRTLSRLITLVENGDTRSLEILEEIHALCGRAKILGITGPPGAGKSTLVDQLISYMRNERQESVGVLAIDPASPFSGGALLGDRIRMQGHCNDSGVFIRSLSNKGARGGLSFSTRLLLKIYDAYGFDWIIIETVGVGQSEVDVKELADTTAVILVPESGDTVQTMKAGLFEIADLFVVNKSDREGASSIAQELNQMIAIDDSPPRAWKPPVLMTEANSGKGTHDLYEAILRHTEYVKTLARKDERKEGVRKKEALEISLMLLGSYLEQMVENSRSLKEEFKSQAYNPFRAAKKIIQSTIKMQHAKIKR